MGRRGDRADADDRQGTSESVCHLERVLKLGDFDRAIGQRRLDHRRRQLRILEVDHSRHQLARQRRGKIRFIELDLDRMSRRQTGRRKRSINQFDGRIEFGTGPTGNLRDLKSIDSADQ